MTDHDLDADPDANPDSDADADETGVEATGEPPTLILATANEGKVLELQELLAGAFTVRPRPAELPETVEDGDTLEANAAKKAVEVAAHTGSPALADDTGLFVAALDGRPGVQTARFGGPGATSADNIAKLLSELDGIEDRRAHFATVLVLADQTGPLVVASGRVDGVIAPGADGEGGFGYDPVFVPDEGGGRTFAAMSRGEKQSISHRARALADLRRQIGDGPLVRTGGVEPPSP